MLDISFYSTNNELPSIIEVSDTFYKWLAKSDFAEIGVSRAEKITLENEDIELNVVDLDKGQISNRTRFRDFIAEAIVQESNDILVLLGDSPSKKEYQAAMYKLKKLHEIRKCFETKTYRFLGKGV